MATQISINGKLHEQMPVGTVPQQGDQFIGGLLFREVVPATTATKAPAAATTKAPAATATKAPAAATTKAPAATATKAPATTTPSWAWILGIIGLLIIAFLAYLAVNTPTGGNTGNNAPIANPTQGSNSPSGIVSEATVLDLGSIGAYHAVMDTNKNQWTLGIWEEASTRKGVGLSEFKSRASSVSFVMPADGTINNSAGHVSVNGTEWKLGNPIVDLSGNTTVPQGANVTIWSDGANESFGFQIWFNK